MKVKTDQNVEKVRTVVRTDCRLGMRMSVGELSVDKEMTGQILTTSLNMKKVCATVILNSLSEDTSVFN